MAELLKFRYFLVVLLLLGCGPEAGKKEARPEAVEAETPDAPKTEAAVILFFGDSLTAGYGLEPAQAFPARIGERLDSLGYPYRVVNAGLSGETTAGGRSRLDWILRQEVDVFVLELGANDGLRGIPLTETRENLVYIIRRVREKYPDATVVLAGMQIPPNMGPEYTDTFQNLFPEIAKAEETYLIPFLLKDVGGVPELNQADGIHPTAKGHEMVADNVWEVLKGVLKP